MVKSVLAAASLILLCFPLLGKNVRFIPLLSRPNNVRFLSCQSHCILLCAIAYQPRPWILRSSSRQLGLNLGSPALSFLGARHAAARHSYYYVLREDHCGLLRTVHIKPSTVAADFVYPQDNLSSIYICAGACLSSNSSVGFSWIVVNFITGGGRVVEWVCINNLDQDSYKLSQLLA